MDIEKLAASEAAWLAQQEAATRLQLLTVYKDSFDELEAKLTSMERPSYSRAHVRAIQAQLGVLIQEMGDRGLEVLKRDTQLTFAGKLFRERDAWTELEHAFGDPLVAEQFASILPVVPQRKLKALFSAQAVAMGNFTTELTQTVRKEIGKSLIAGEGMKVTVKRLRSIEGAPKNPARLHLIGRMEHARAAVQAQEELVSQVNQQYPELDMWLMIKGRVDRTKNTRNHWMTWGINGTVRNVTKGEFFEIHAREIAAARKDYEAVTGKKTYNHGILWKRFELGYRSKTIPAHYHDRDVLVTWRPAWGLTAFGAVKHPQGAIPGLDGPRASSNQSPPPAPIPDLPPTGRLRNLTGPQARADMQAAGKEAKALKTAFNKDFAAREKDILRLQKKKSLTLLEGQRLNRLLMGEIRAIRDYETQLHQLGQELRAAILQPGPSRLQLEPRPGVSAELLQKVELAAEAFSQMVGERLPERALEIKNGLKPRFIPPNILELPEKVAPKLIVHEFTHFFESIDRAALQDSLKFLDNRVRDEKFVRLMDVSKLGLFSRDEWTRVDGFADPYSGKSYYFPRKGETERSKPLYDGEPPLGSELLSTGFEQMYRNPALFAAEDPEFFDFIWEVMHGPDSVPR